MESNNFSEKERVIKYPIITFPYGKPIKILASKEDFDEAGIKMPIKKSDVSNREPEKEESKSLLEMFNEFISENEEEPVTEDCEDDIKNTGNTGNSSVLDMLFSKSESKPQQQEQQKLKPGRGQKTCPHCQSIIGVRSIACKFCGKNIK